MKFLMMIKHAEGYRHEEVPEALMAAMGEFVGESMKRGIVKDTAGLKPTSEGFRIRLSKGQLKVSDGPFTEAKEVIGGYALVDVPSKKDALRSPSSSWIFTACTGRASRARARCAR